MRRGLSGSIDRVWLLASNTFLEAVRQKFFRALLLISVGLVVSSNFFQQFDFGTSELKFITDFGFGVLFVFGSILSIVVMVQLFFNEIENRTALTMLAKPVHRLEFLWGKFLGAHFLMLAFTAVIVATLAGILYWRETTLMAQLGEEVFSAGRLVDYGDLLIFGLLQWIKFGVIAAIALFIASSAHTNLYTLVVTAFVTMICQLQYIARDAYGGMEWGVSRFLVQFLGLIFPNFQLFNVGDQLVFKSEYALSFSALWKIAGYGCVYTIAFVLFAQVNFKQREV